MILVVSFGTSYNETRAKNIDAIENDIAKAFPDHELRRAFTSGMIIRKLQKRDGVKVDTVTEALEKMADEGIKEVVVKPLWRVRNSISWSMISPSLAADSHL